MYEKGGVFADREQALPPARFVMLPSKDKQASIKAGHEVYVEKPYIEIMKQGGDINTFAVNDEFKGRYPEKWEMFEAGLEAPKVGLPLENWPGCSRTECENLKSVNFFTVEDLAAASDLGLDSYGMGGRKLKKKAAAYLEAAKDNGAVTAKLEALEKKFEAVISANDELKEHLRNADVEIQALRKKEEVTASTEEPKRKPGRPRKE